MEKKKIKKILSKLCAVVSIVFAFGLGTLATPQKEVRAEERTVQRKVVTDEYEEYTVDELLTTYVQYSSLTTYNVMFGATRQSYSRQTYVSQVTSSSVRYHYFAMKLPYDFIDKFGSYMALGTFTGVTASTYINFQAFTTNNDNVNFISLSGNEKYPTIIATSGYSCYVTTSNMSFRTDAEKFDWYDNDVDYAPFFVAIQIPANAYISSLKVRFFYGDSGGQGYYTGVQNGIDRVVSRPNEYDLYTEEQYNAYGDYKFNQGMATTEDTFLQSSFWALATIPVNTISSMLNFNVGGFNLFPIFMTFISILLATALIKALV